MFTIYATTPSPSDLYKPLRALHKAYYGNEFPKIILIHITGLSGDGHVLPLRIDQVESGYKITILQSIDHRNQLPGVAPSAIQYEQYKVITDQDGIDLFIKRMKQPFDRENSFFKAFIETILAIHRPKETIPKINTDEHFEELLHSKLQRQGTCQGKAFKRSLKTFCDSKQNYQVLKTDIIRRLIDACKQLEELSFNEKVIINLSIENYARLVKKLQGGTSIHDEIDLLPLDVMQIEPKETVFKPQALAISFPNVIKDKKEYPLVGRNDVRIEGDFDNLSNSEQELLFLKVVKNCIQQGVEINLSPNFKKIMNKLPESRNAEFRSLVISHLSLLLELKDTVSRCDELSSGRHLKQFAYERYLDAVTRTTVIDRVRKASQSAITDNEWDEYTYEIWSYIQKETHKIQNDLEKIRIDEKSSDFKTPENTFEKKLQEDSDFYREETYPISYYYLCYFENCDSYYCKAGIFEDISKSLISNVFYFLLKCSISAGYRVSSLHKYEPNTDLSQLYSSHYPLMSTFGVRPPYKCLTGLSDKQAAVLLEDQESPMIQQLLMLSVSHAPVVALEKVTSFLATQATNVYDYFKGDQSNHFLNAFEYINHLLRRSGALVVPKAHKTKAMEILLSQAIVHLEKSTFIEYALLMDMVNTLLFSIVSNEVFEPSERFLELIEQHTEMLFKASYGQHSIITELNGLKEKYPNNVLKLFSMLLVASNVDAKRQAAIFAHQSLLNQFVDNTKKKTRFENMMILLLPYINQDLECDSVTMKRLVGNEKWQFSLKKGVNPVFEATNTQSGKSTILQTMPPLNCEDTELLSHYVHLGQNLFCHHPLDLINDYLGLRLLESDLRLVDGFYHFSYQGRSYSIDYQDNIYFGDQFILQTSRSDKKKGPFVLFQEIGTDNFIMVIPEVSSPSYVQVVDQELSYNAMSISKTSPSLDYESCFNHPRLGHLGAVIRGEDTLFFPTTKLLLHYTEDKKHLYPAQHKNFLIPVSSVASQVPFFAPLEQLDHSQHAVFYDEIKKHTLVCLWEKDQYVFLAVNGDHLVPSNNQEFLFLFRTLMKYQTKYLSTYLMLEALQYFSPMERDAHEVMDAVMASIANTKGFIDPKWYVFSKQLLDKIPQYHPDRFKKNDLIEVLNKYATIVTNLDSNEVSFFSEYRFGFENASWYLDTEDQIIDFWLKRVDTGFCSELPRLDGYFNTLTKVAQEVFRRRGLVDSQVQQDTHSPNVYMEHSVEKLATLKYPNFLSLPLASSEIKLEAPSSPQVSPIYGFVPDQFVLPRELSHPYTASLSDKVFDSIEASRDEVMQNSVSKEDLLAKLSEHARGYLSECDAMLEQYKAMQQEYENHILAYCEKALDWRDLASGKINLKSKLFHGLIDMDELVKLGAFPVKTIQAKLGISPSDALNLQKSLHYYVFSTVEIQYLNQVKKRIERYQENQGDPVNNEELYMLLSTQRPAVLSDHAYYPLLQYELYSGFRARHGQQSLYKAICIEKENKFIAELKPGAGKTSILPAIAVSQTLQGDTVIVELPQALYQVQSKQMEQVIRRYGLQCYHLHRLKEVHQPYLSALNTELQHAKREGKVIFSTVSEVQALRLQVQLFERENPSDKDIVQTLDSFLKEATYMVDEVDQELSPTRVVNIPIGRKEPTSVELQHLISDAMRYISLVEPKLNNSVLEEGFHGTHPQDTTLSSEEVDQLIEKVLALLPQDNKALIQQVSSFIKAYHHVIFMSKNNYAKSEENKYIAVPANGGVPISGTNFSNPVTKLITSWLVANQSGMDPIKLRALVLNFSRQIIRNNQDHIDVDRDDKFLRIFSVNKLSEGSPDSSESFREAVKIIYEIIEISGALQSEDDKGLDDIVDLILELSKIPEAQKIMAELFSIYIKEQIFPHITLYHEKVSLGPYDHYRDKIFGVTGTTHGIPALQIKEGEFPLNHNVQGRLSGDGNTLHYLMNLEDKKQLSFIPYETFAKGPKVWEEKYLALIDQAKLVNPPNTEEYVKEFFQEIPSEFGVQCILFFMNNSFYGYAGSEIKKINTTSKADIESTMGVQMDECFMLYDSARTRGCDIPLSKQAKGLLTIDVNTKLDDLIQSAMRLRQLGKGQSLSIVLTPELSNKLGDEPTVDSLVEYLSIKDQQSFKQNEFIASAFQAVKAVCAQWVEKQSQPELEDSQAELLFILRKNKNDVDISQFSKAVTAVQLRDELEKTKTQLRTLIETYGFAAEELDQQMQAIIEDKLQICDETLLSMRADTDTQIETSQQVQHAMQHAVQHALNFNLTASQSLEVTDRVAFGTYPITQLHPKASNRQILISHDAWTVLKQGADSDQRALAKTLPFYHLLIKDNEVIIISSEEAGDEALYSGYELMLSSDFDQIMQKPEPLRQTLYQTIIYLGQGLELVNYLITKGVQLPNVVQFAKEADMAINRYNLPVLKALSGYIDLNYVLEHITPQNVEVVLEYTNLERLDESKRSLLITNLLELSDHYKSLKQFYTQPPEDMLEKNHALSKNEGYCQAYESYKASYNAIIDLFGSTKRMQAFYQSLLVALKAILMVKSVTVRKQFLKKKAATRKIQAAIRRYLKQKAFKQEQAATSLQAVVRGYLARMEFKPLKREKQVKREEQAETTTHPRFEGAMAGEQYQEVQKDELSRAQAVETTTQPGFEEVMAVEQDQGAQKDELSRVQAAKTTFEGERYKEAQKADLARAQAAKTTSGGERYKEAQKDELSRVQPAKTTFEGERDKEAKKGGFSKVNIAYYLLAVLLTIGMGVSVVFMLPPVTYGLAALLTLVVGRIVYIKKDHLRIKTLSKDNDQSTADSMLPKHKEAAPFYVQDGHVSGVLSENNRRENDLS